MRMTRLPFLCYLLIPLLCGWGPALNAQVVTQDFNQSVNQIGDCWRRFNMEITTKKTINRSNQKKALVGTSPLGQPAYSFTSPFLSFQGTGSIDFAHKLNGMSGNYRDIKLELLTPGYQVVQTLYSHIYRQNGANANGNPSQPRRPSIPITWSGTYILRWSFSGSGGGKSLAMIDDISINATDVSNSSNANGYGYCRPDETHYDTICAGTTAQYRVPHPIPSSHWEWDFFPPPSAGTLDTTLVPGPADTLAAVQWKASASGDYQIEVTEVKFPHGTRTFSIRYFIHIDPRPRTGPIYHY